MKKESEISKLIQNSNGSWQDIADESYDLGYEAAQPKWISVETELPPHLETVWISNGSNYVSLGCRVDFNYEDGWHWAESNGLIYIEDGKITAECESEDLDVKFWMPLPKPPYND